MKNIFRRITSTRLIIGAALFLALFDNLAFFSNVLQVYPPSLPLLAFLVSLAVALPAVTCLFLLLVCFRYTLKPILMALFLVASVTGYFMNTYNTIIDVGMVQNAAQTSFRESLDLFSWQLLLSFLLLGVLPSVAVYRAKVEYGSFKSELLDRLKLAGVVLLLVALPVFGLSKFYASFFREHKELRYYAYSDQARPVFRREADRHSDLMATGIPAGSRPMFRSNPTGCL